MLAPTLAGLREVALGADDASGYFPAMYARVTRRVMDGVAAGRFDDGERMEAFVELFATRYLDAHRSPVAAPRCWRGSFDVAADGSMLVVQHLLLGINAHVNFDLPQTVVDLADAGVPIATIRPDFDAINLVLAEVYDDLLGDLGRVSRWTGAAASAGGGRIFRFSLTAARDQAWRAAVRLHALGSSARQAEVAALDDLVAVLAYLVARPTVPFRWVLPLARRLEQRDPAIVTRTLLGPLADT